MGPPVVSASFQALASDPFLGLCRDNGKENGNGYILGGGIILEMMENKMETAILNNVLVSTSFPLSRYTPNVVLVVLVAID